LRILVVRPCCIHCVFCRGCVMCRQTANTSALSRPQFVKCTHFHMKMRGRPRMFIFLVSELF
jgi:hypothetical protein